MKTTDTDRSVLALFICEPIGVDGAMEANGTVYHFCSDFCRRTFEIDLESEQEAHTGESPDWITGTVCDECGAAL